MEDFHFSASTIILIVLGILFLIGICLSFFTVNQGEIAVITRFGKYVRINRPGLSMKLPFIETVFSRESIQNQSMEIKFQAITSDQANVFFNTMILFAVQNATEETIQKVAFKFIDEDDLNRALTRTIEGSVRSFVASKKQSEILSIRKDITGYVKEHVDEAMQDWGYHLQDLQINDISFDKAITESMSQVVASANLKAAAENEGQALLIKKTRAAEAEGNAIKISAAAEKEAAKLRGEGVSAFRQAVSNGIKESAGELKEAGLDTNVILFSMWTEAVKNFAEVGKGNVIFLDGSPEGMQRSMNQFMGYTKAAKPNGVAV